MSNREQGKDFEAEIPQEVLDSPEFEAVWQAIKGWDLARYPGAGYAGATGTDVLTILNALKPVHQSAIQEAVKEELERLRSYGHGGGNWRRLIEIRLTELSNNKEEE
jgi:hypothetical protein